MNRLALVLAISLSVSMASAAPGVAGPNGESQRSENGSLHGSSGPAAARPGSMGKPPAPAPATRPAPVRKPAAKSAPKSTGHGANVSGPYDPSGVDNPSQNGKGTGGQGRPCAGCVGKADGKNPPGQMPGGSDHNAGYECDRNEGIGRTNPAHSGCGEQSSVGPIENPIARVGISALRAAALHLIRSAASATLVPTGAEGFDTRVLAARQSVGDPGADGGGGHLIPAADRSLVGDALPMTGLAVGLMALLGAAIAGAGLLLRSRTRIPTSAG